jgi:hypothetical protein
MLTDGQRWLVCCTLLNCTVLFPVFTSALCTQRGYDDVVVTCFVPHDGRRSDTLDVVQMQWI